jgi:hypothetical protein
VEDLAAVVKAIHLKTEDRQHEKTSIALRYDFMNAKLSSIDAVERVYGP